jgi:hypothetical protein
VNAAARRWTVDDLQTIGYFAKQPLRPFESASLPKHIEWVCTGCWPDEPPDWFTSYRFNELFVFDTLALLESVIPPDSAAKYLRLGLRSLPVQFADDGHGGVRELPLAVASVKPEPIPAHFVRLGFDVTSRSSQSTLEHSPLSCNGMAAEIATNRWCLIDAFDDALQVPGAFVRGGAKEGPYVVLEVWAERQPGT